VIPGKVYTPEDIAFIAWRRKWWAILPAVVITGLAFGWIRTLPNQYMSDTLILVVPQQVPETYVRSTVTTRIEDRLQTITQQILSRTRLERIIQDFNLYPELRRTSIMEDVVERMRTSIAVQVVKGDAFRVSFTSDDARTSMRVTERLASLFIEENLRDREVLAEGTNQFLGAQLEEARRRLVETEHKVEEYKKQYDGQLPEQREANMQGMHNNEMQLQQLLDQLNRARDRKATLERQIADFEAAEITVTPAAGPAGAETAAQQLELAQAKLQEMQGHYKDTFPDIQRQKRLIADLQKKADAEALARPLNAPATAAEVFKKGKLADGKAELQKLEKQIADMMEQEQRLRGSIGTYQKRIEAAPARDAELTELTRDYRTLQATYTGLLVKQEDSKVAANLERRQIGEQFKILDPARLPERPSSPNRQQLQMFGIGLALGLGIALAALIEYLDKTLKSEMDVRAALNLVVLAGIPVLPEVTVRGGRRWKMVAISAAVLLVAAAGTAAVVWKVWR